MYHHRTVPFSRRGEEMTLVEYEKLQTEKRKVLLPLKGEERKVNIDEDFKNMQLLESKKNKDVIFAKLEETKRSHKKKKKMLLPLRAEEAKVNPEDFQKRKSLPTKNNPAGSYAKLEKPLKDNKLHSKKSEVKVVKQQLTLEERMKPWIKPKKGWLKLNIDHKFPIMANLWGIGGLVRDELGQWVVGFMGKPQEGTKLKLTFLALKEGLLAIDDKMMEGKVGLIIESRSWDLHYLLKDDNHRLYEFYQTSIDECSPACGVPYFLAIKGSLLKESNLQILEEAPNSGVGIDVDINEMLLEDRNRRAPSPNSTD